MDCTKKQELLERAQRTLSDLESLAHAEQDALASGNIEHMLSIDKRLELAVGEKERAIGAYQEHLREHKC